MNERERLGLVAQVFDFMRKQRITLADLIEMGGEDLDSSDFRKVEIARRVGTCWALMARLGVTFGRLEQAAGPQPPKSRAASDVMRGCFQKSLKTKGFLTMGPQS
jgi:hypothetical protein